MTTSKTNVVEPAQRKKKINQWTEDDALGVNFFLFQPVTQLPV